MADEPSTAIAPAESRDLTEKRERFCREILIDDNAAAAAKRAGYSTRSAKERAYQLMQTPEVQARIAELRAERAARTAITADYVLARLKENLERAMTAEPVLDRDGNPIGEYRYDGAVANKALELLGKHLGMFTDRVDHTTGGAPLPPANLIVTLVKP